MGDCAVCIGSTRLELEQGDISRQDIDAIGNAANTKLAGGGGVDGAIHRAGGAAIMRELRATYPQGCPTGQAVITGGGELKARYVIHAVGPRYSNKPEDAELLALAYRSSLRLCSRYQIREVALPSISTGIYGYPVEEAATVALRTIAEYVSTYPGIEVVRLVLFDKNTYDAYLDALTPYRRNEQPGRLRSETKHG